ncbi:MAG: type II secretion system minor pseudopilin GspI [Marinospirillum sp.]|uniref:type II secretion system minor pseudopilin GspI n=1 Tax=Marinospirillum sp. TaxID=2183934 RepID=UPI0019F6979A|nr:type II secretion system minor pseudopilin GspI [Marinospirillum sp.]MBE0505862.1 type II secretion system minor pseudopilin GspI [Marinospirillum sp.]
MNPDLHRQQGLTLVEVLVALMILAMMAGVSAEVISRAVDIRLVAEERALGQLCADNLLTSRMLDESWPELGSQEGQSEAGRLQCYWRVNVQATPLPTMRRLDIQVYADATRQQLLTQVSGFVGQR